MPYPCLTIKYGGWRRTFFIFHQTKRTIKRQFSRVLSHNRQTIICRCCAEQWMNAQQTINTLKYIRQDCTTRMVQKSAMNLCKMFEYHDPCVFIFVFNFVPQRNEIGHTDEYINMFEMLREYDKFHRFLLLFCINNIWIFGWFVYFSHKK